MSFDPTLPVEHSPIVSAELRNQFNGLKDLIDGNLPASEKGAPNGVASLDSNSLLEQEVSWGNVSSKPSLVIATGVGGGQSISGGTGAGESLTLSSTSHPTKGSVHIGTGAGNAVGIGNASGTVSITSSGFTINTNGVFQRGGNYVDLQSPNLVLAPFGAGLTIFDGISSCRSNNSHAWQAIALTAGAVPWVCKGAAGQTAALLRCVDSTGAEQFGIGAGGQLRTNQSATATTPGSVVKRLPVYDATGALLGYLPVYDAIS